MIIMSKKNQKCSYYCVYICAIVANLLLLSYLSPILKVGLVFCRRDLKYFCLLSLSKKLNCIFSPLLDDFLVYLNYREGGSRSWVKKLLTIFLVCFLSGWFYNFTYWGSSCWFDVSLFLIRNRPLGPTDLNLSLRSIFFLPSDVICCTS